MVVKRINKTLIIGIIIVLISSQQVFANNWKQIENNKINKISIYLQTDTIKKEDFYVTFTTRLNIKKVGDYINVVQTNCTDLSSATLGTYEYSKDFSINYENLKTSTNLTPIDKTSSLYNVAQIACTSENTYNTVHPKKENLFIKVAKGIGTVIGYIFIAPLAILAIIFGSN